ncbi:hypothetical protein ERJ75_000720600 [Trypanosoma vivax]|nr:hypothetical protein ERJ75_000720600 [Trypanosoma vivax]
MPIPQATFTKSKWLAFFAELTAKITHHNVLVVIEGCEILKRLLVSRVSVAAFLEEGNLLLVLVDTIAGDVLSGQHREDVLPIVLADKLLFTRLETLSLFVDMMVALHADKDPYYCLLVQARAGVVLSTLVSMLECKHPHYFGIIATMVNTLLGLPLGRASFGRSEQFNVDESRSVALACHLKRLLAEIAEHKAVLEGAVGSLKSLCTVTERAMHFCSQYLLMEASKNLKRIRTCGGNVPTLGKVTPNDTSIPCPRTTCDAAEGSCPHVVPSQRLSASNTDVPVPDAAQLPTNGTRTQTSSEDETPETIIIDDDEICIPEEMYTEYFEDLSRSSSHDEYLCAMNSLWCLTVASGNALQRRFSRTHFDKAFKRFLQVVPLNQQDYIVFTSVLLWLSHMMARYTLCTETREAISSVAGQSLMQMVLNDLSSHDVSTMFDSSSVLTANTMSQRTDTSAPVPLPLTSSLSLSKGMKSSVLVERPSVSFVVLSFLLIAHQACEKRLIELWVRDAGLFAMIEALIHRVSRTKSVLIDTPTTVDGLLSDEVYLACAMKSTRTEHITLGALACKLLSSVVWNHYAVLSGPLASLSARMLQEIIPLLLQISIQNPTLASPVENVSGSAIHHSPSCQRSSRYTSLGECSVVALDACFWLMQAAKLDVLSLKDVMPYLPGLSRATVKSIHPPLRASTYRTLSRVCTTAEDILLVEEEMPSLMKSAVKSVLEYSKDAPQWEAAAAAEWLLSVTSIMSRDDRMEKMFSFSHTDLPTRLLELTASNGITNATCAFLSLMTALFEQQKRLTDRSCEVFINVLLPRGNRSLECWSHLVRVATQSNEKLRLAYKKVVPSSTNIKDAPSRALNCIEGISIQFSFVGSLSRGLLFLLSDYPAQRAYFPSDVFWGLFAGTFALPSPCDIFEMVSLRFNATIEHHDVLQESYESMLQWMVELASAWVRAGDGISGTGSDSTVVTGCFPTTLFESLCAILKNERVSQNTRAHICMFVSNIIVAMDKWVSYSQNLVSSPLSSLQQTSTRENTILRVRQLLAASSASLLDTSMQLRHSTCVSGMQCRLVSSFAEANIRAHESGWFTQNVDTLVKCAKNLKGSSGVLAEREMETLLLTLSLVYSVVAFSDCPPIERSIQQQLSSSLRCVLSFEMTRRAGFHAAFALAKSKEGRRCLLHEVTTACDPLARTCFGRVLAVTLGFSSGCERPHTDKGTCLPGMSVAEREANREVVRALGFEVCATACIGGGEAFVHGVMKLKGIERMEAFFLSCERQRIAVPLGLFRLLAAISFYADVQPVIMRQRELMTILIETSSDACDAGTLSLLILRNLCFHPTLKAQLCQDERILETLKDVLIAQPTRQRLSSPDKDDHCCRQNGKNKRDRPRLTGDGINIGVAADELGKVCADGTSPVADLSASCRRELGRTACWSLVHDNQRGRSFLRKALSQSPAVSCDDWMPPRNQVVELSEQSQQCLVSTAINCKEVVGTNFA